MSPPPIDVEDQTGGRISNTEFVATVHTKFDSDKFYISNFKASISLQHISPFSYLLSLLMTAGFKFETWILNLNPAPIYGDYGDKSQSFKCNKED